ncbi:hypothetical protein IIA16_00010 [bacterium]|nr:hypothetical protein [bacterium]
MRRLPFLPQDSLDWQMLVISLALAITVYARATAGNPNAERQFVLGEQEIIIQYLPSDYELAEELEFTATLTGSPTRLELINVMDDLEVLLTFLELPAEGGRAQADLLLRAPPGIRIKESNPRRVLVKVARFSEREMPLIVFQYGRLPTGVRLLGRPEALPPNVLARGPVATMGRLATAQVEMNLGTTVRSESLEVRPQARDEAGRALFGIEFVPAVIQLAVEVETVRESRLVPVRPDTTGVLASGYALLSVSVSPALVVVEGPVEIIRELEAVLTTPIDLGGLSGPLTTMATLLPPEGATTDYAEVEVTIEVREIFGEMLLRGVPVGLRGGPEGIPYTIVPAIVDLILQGPVHVLASLDPLAVLGDIRVEVLPCDTAVQVECERLVQVVLPAGLTVKEKIPDRVTLRMGKP